MSRSFSLYPEVSRQKQFFDKLYQDYIKLMYFTASRYCTIATERQDIVQEAFLKLLNHYDTLKLLSPTALAGYVYFTVKSTVFDHGRKVLSDKRLETALTEIAKQSIMDVPDIVEILMQEETFRELESVLDSLSKTDQLLLIGKYFLNYSDEEIAAQLGCKPGSIRMKLTRARRNALKLIKERGLFEDE